MDTATPVSGMLPISDLVDVLADNFRSGIGPWYADYLPTTTWEGDNYMLTQQVARYVSLSPFIDQYELH